MNKLELQIANIINEKKVDSVEVAPFCFYIYFTDGSTIEIETNSYRSDLGLGEMKIEVIQDDRDVQSVEPVKAMYNEMKCKDCVNWTVYPTSPDLGICKAIGVLDGDGNDVGIVANTYIDLSYPVTELSRPTSDYDNVRTSGNFGCVRFVSK